MRMVRAGGAVHVVIAGGSGLLGRALTTSLAASSSPVVVLSRRPSFVGHERPGRDTSSREVDRHAGGATEPERRIPGPVHVVGWAPDGRTGPWASQLRGARAIVNLAGTSIAGFRWTSTRKTDILQSRLLATRSLVEAMASLDGPRPLLINSSAIGYYGVSDDRLLDEQSPPGRGFLAEVCVRAEEEAQRAAHHDAPVALLRTGVVLAVDGGALPRMALPFRLFAGGHVGSGRQFLSWIHVDDWVGIVRWLIEKGAVTGPINVTAPDPVTNATFSGTLGRVLRRPVWLPVPAAALRLAFGEMADEVLLGGQRVMPARALSFGYRFAFPDLEAALRDLYGPESTRDQ